MKKWFSLTAVCVILLCSVVSSWASEYSDLRKRMDFWRDDVENNTIIEHKHKVWAIDVLGNPGLSMKIQQRNADGIKVPLIFIYSAIMLPSYFVENVGITVNIDGDIARFGNLSTNYDIALGSVRRRWIWLIISEEQTKKLADKIAKSKKTLIRLYTAGGTERDFSVTDRQKKVVGEMLRFYDLIGDMPLNGPETSADGGDSKIEVADIGLKIENYIAKVSSTGLAQKCGLPDGSKILEVNGKKAEEIPNLQRYIEERVQSGKSVMLACEKDGKTEMITLKGRIKP